jgi:hypothetical protein
MQHIVPLPNVKYQIDEQNDLFKTKQKKLEADKLENKILQTAWDIFSVICFPVGLARLGLLGAKKIAPLIILPASSAYNLERLRTLYERQPLEKLRKQIAQVEALHQNREKFLADPSNHAEQVTLKTADEAELDLLCIQHPAQKELPYLEQKWFIYFQGNLMCYEQRMSFMKELSDKMEANILVGNYRGVMRSKGEVEDSLGMVLDGEAMVQYLLSKGVPPGNIYIHGMSLGGAIGTAVAALHPGIHNTNENSFATLSDYLKSKLSAPLAVILGKMLLSAGWLFDSVRDYQKITGNKLILFSKEDGVIRYEASLYKRLKEAQRQALQAQKKECKANEHKPEFVRISVDMEKEGKPLSRQEIIEKHGHEVHCYSVLDENSPLSEKYMQFVKQSLRI